MIILHNFHKYRIQNKIYKSSRLGLNQREKENQI